MTTASTTTWSCCFYMPGELYAAIQL